MTPQSDEDEIWRQIVASYHEPAELTSGEQPWPDSENLPAGPARNLARRPAEEPPPRDAAADEPPEEGSDLAQDGEDEDEHYIPPPPPPLPKTDTSTKIAWLALFGGPAYLLLAVMFGWDLQGWVLFAAVASFIGGFVALVVRMGDHGDSGWDDGAVV